MLICDILFPFTLYDTGATFSNNLLPEILSRKSSMFSLSITVLPSCGKNFTTASDILSVTQPALSKAISKLEEELDVKLFQKEGRNIKITEFGDVFLKYAKGALSEVEKGKFKLKEMKNNSDMIISIS